MYFTDKNIIVQTLFFIRRFMVFQKYLKNISFIIWLLKTEIAHGDLCLFHLILEMLCMKLIIKISKSLQFRTKEMIWSW